MGGLKGDGGGCNPGETWFRHENSIKETRAFMRLEGELNATLLFEHGGRQSASLLWIACILLGHLFREQLALGWTMKVFSKHYPKDVMRTLVKIQDLVDLVEPPMEGISASTSAGQWWSDEMELDANEEEPKKNAQDAPDSPGEANIGLG